MEVDAGVTERGELERVVDRLAERQRLSVEPRAQRRALQELGDDIGAALDGADIEDADDIGVIERAGRARLLLEAAELLLVARAGVEQLARAAPDGYTIDIGQTTTSAASSTKLSTTWRRTSRRSA